MTWVPIEVCIKRDSKRTGSAHVGEKVIRDMAKRFNIKPSLITDKVEIDPNLPYAVICDIDGTVALNESGRNFYDETLVSEDTPRLPVIVAVKALANYNSNQLIFLSGRTTKCYFETKDWLIKKAKFDDNFILLMRSDGDKRRDSIVKKEIFDKHIRGKFNVFAVFDDRPQVINECWLPMGLTVFNVGNGRDF